MPPKPPSKPSSVLFIHLPPPPPAHGQLALDGVDAVADGGEDDEEDDYDDGDDDVALDHGGERVGLDDAVLVVWMVEGV